MVSSLCKAMPTFAFTQTSLMASLLTYDKRGMAVQTDEPGREIASTTDVTTGAVQTLTTKRWYNAFGEVKQEQTARGKDTFYTYNTMGRVVKAEAPAVTVTGENGVDSTSAEKPTQHFVYDKSGRLVATSNAMTGSASPTGFWTTRVLLAGSGYGDAEALVTSEFRPDSSEWKTGYDVFGNARKITDGGNNVTTQEFDLLGRVTQITRPAGSAGSLIDYYAYDGLGQRTKHWNNVYGSGVVETTDYDRLGRVVSAVNFASDATVTSYAWNAATHTSGLGTYGAWTKTTSILADRYSTGDSIVAATEKTDAFGHVIAKTDMLGAETTYAYDAAGRLLTQTRTTGSTVALTNTYWNTGLLKSSVVDEPYVAATELQTLTTTARYDADGQRVHEKLVRTYSYFQPFHNWEYGGYWTATDETLADGRVTYDDAGRMATYVDKDGGGMTIASVAWKYDAAGNIRNMNAQYKAVLGADVLATSNTTQNYWYKYDSLNRMVTSKGSLSGTTIGLGTEGIGLTYNAAGRRATATYGVSGNLETYGYDAAGNLTSVTITPSGGSVVTRAASTYDKLGRELTHDEYGAAGTSQLVHKRYDVEYDKRGLVLAEKTATLVGSDWIHAHTANTYTQAGQSASSALPWGTSSTGSSSGSMLSRSDTKNWKSTSSTLPAYGGDTGSNPDGALKDALRTNSYYWGGQDGQAGPVQAGSSVTNKDGTSASTYYRDGGGRLVKVVVSGGARPHNVVYKVDGAGRVVRRQDSGMGSGGGPAERYYRFDGIDIGTAGNDGTGNVDYATAIANRTATPGTGAYRNGGASAVYFADFDQSYDAVNPSSQAAASGSYYTVQAGDTLQGIALAAWGDASLWYLIAEANGLGGNTALAAGTGLVIPQGANLHNNAGTFRPYDANQALGDVQPGMPKPKPKGNKCGGFGQILLAAIAVAVTMIALPSGAPTFLQGALAGFAGSAASQTVGVVTGIQDKFDFKGLALSTIAGGVTAGLGDPKVVGGKISSFMKVDKFLNAAVRGIAGNALTQGIGVATGLQDKVSWAGVAAGGVSAGLGGEIKLPGPGGRVFADTAGGIAASAAQSLITGKSFGDTLVSSLPGIIGNTVGNLVAGKIAGSGSPKDDIVVNQSASQRAERYRALADDRPSPRRGCHGRRPPRPRKPGRCPSRYGSGDSRTASRCSDCARPRRGRVARRRRS